MLRTRSKIPDQSTIFYIETDIYNLNFYYVTRQVFVTLFHFSVTCHAVETRALLDFVYCFSYKLFQTTIV